MEPRRRTGHLRVMTSALRLGVVACCWAPRAAGTATPRTRAISMCWTPPDRHAARTSGLIFFCGDVRMHRRVSKEMDLGRPRSKLIPLGGTLSCRFKVTDWEQQMAALSLLQPVALASRRGPDLNRSWATQPQVTIGCIDDGPMPHEATETKQRRQLTVWNCWCRKAFQSMGAIGARQGNGNSRFPLALLLPSPDPHDAHGVLSRRCDGWWPCSRASSAC